jgi:hypothetical protein
MAFEENFPYENVDAAQDVIFVADEARTARIDRSGLDRRANHRGR